MKTKYLPGILFLLLIFIKPAFAKSEYVKFIHQHGKEILKEYRIPEGGDLSYWGTDKNTYFYKYPDAFGNAKAPYWTNGYFNEDGTLDYAYILFKRDNSQPFLICFLSANSSYKNYIIGESGKSMCAATDTFETIKDSVNLSKYPKHIIQHFALERHGIIIY